jgi:hypothetical protein
MTSMPLMLLLLVTAHRLSINRAAHVALGTARMALSCHQRNRIQKAHDDYRDLLSILALAALA